MANGKATASFFENGTTAQFEYCFKLYPQVLKLKAEKRCKKPQELIRLDQWYQNELPKLIKARGKDAHMVYDELVQTMKWKQSRGKFYPQLSYLVKVNTPRAVVQETKKAFRKLPNLEQAITALSNLKGVGTTMASALLAAAAPDSAPFMADECLMAIPEIEGIDYTTKEYLNFVQHIQSTVQRLNVEFGGEIPKWSPHRVELALWSHYVANDLSPELLDDMPGPGSGGSATNGNITAVDGDIDEKALDGEDTNDGDDESLGVVGRNIATESETENENTNPAILTPVATATGVATVGVLQDGDSNFVSNDSTSQEPIIDENTTLTTATTSTDDGEVINTPLASDSESNIEAPLKANHNATATASAQLLAPAQAKEQTSPQLQVLGNSKVTNDNGTTAVLSANVANNANSNIVRSPASITPTAPAAVAVTPITAANGNGNDNGNGAVSNANSDGENSSCVLRSSSANDDENASDADLDDDDDADGEDDEEADESSNSHGCVGVGVGIGGKSQASVPNIINDKTESTLSSSDGPALTSPTIGQKRTALHCGVDAGGGGGGIGAEVGAPPELKKLRTD